MAGEICFLVFITAKGSWLVVESSRLKTLFSGGWLDWHAKGLGVWIWAIHLWPLVSFFEGVRTHVVDGGDKEQDGGGHMEEDDEEEDDQHGVCLWAPNAWNALLALCLPTAPGWWRCLFWLSRGRVCRRSGVDPRNLLEAKHSVCNTLKTYNVAQLQFW